MLKSFKVALLVLASTQIAQAGALNVGVCNLSQKLQDAVSAQINSEFEGAYFYLDLSNQFYLRGLDGFGHWFMSQYDEEILHAKKFISFMNDKDCKVTLSPIASTETIYTNALGLVDKSLSTEIAQTAKIHRLYELSNTENSHDTATLLEWFIEEQVEEEAMFQTLKDRLELAGDSSAALLLIDAELGKRGK